jgi:hypothetical protein
MLLVDEITIWFCALCKLCDENGFLEKPLWVSQKGAMHRFHSPKRS